MKTALIISLGIIAGFAVLFLFARFKMKNIPSVANHDNILTLTDKNFQHQVKDKIVLVDSNTTAMAMGFHVLTAARASQAGAGLAECQNLAEEARKHTGVYFVVDTLEFLHRGGRIGGAAALVGSIAGIALLASFRTPSGPGADPVVLAVGVVARAAATPTIPAATTAQGSVAPPAPPTVAASAPAGTPTPLPTMAAAGSVAAGYSGQVTGDLVSMRYGDVQVDVTFENGAIAAVDAVELPTDGRSRQISQRAAAILSQEVLTAQSAAVDLVSGATYTSVAYRQSLQSAIDQASAQAAIDERAAA